MIARVDNHIVRYVSATLVPEQEIIYGILFVSERIFSLDKVDKVHTMHRERYEQNRRFEEMTDLAERIGFPIETTISYQLRGGSLYALSDTTSRTFLDQTHQAMQEGKYLFSGDQLFEATRRAHEYYEAIDAEQLARGLLGGNVMVKVSKVPDAVVDGTTSIKGYRRDLLRTFVRMYYEDDGFVRCKLFSVDHNNQEGLDRIGTLIGLQLTGRGSEDILADKQIFDVENPDAFVRELSERSIAVYDEAVYEETGVPTRAGSLYIDQSDAQTAVESQPHLLQSHFDAISTIVGMGLNLQAQEDLLEIERKRTAAAISLAARGFVVTSSSDGSVSAEVSNGNYSRECAIATQNAMQQGEADLTKDWIKVVEHCPICGKSKVLASKNGEIITGSCGCSLNVCTGEYTRIQPMTSKPSPIDQSVEKKPSTRQAVKRLYGETAILRTQSVIGGAVHTITDTSTGTVLNSSSDLRRLLDFA